MDFQISRRAAEQGTFAGFVGDLPGGLKAQIFVPQPMVEPKQFSFFWRGQARRDQMHELLERLSTPSSALAARIIGRSYVVNFDYSPTTEPSGWHVGFVHRLIEEVELPASLGLTVGTSGDEGRPSTSVYFWASIDAPERIGHAKGNPELGIRTNLREWNRESFREMIFPIFARTIGLTAGDALDLWNQAGKTASELNQTGG